MKRIVEAFHVAKNSEKAAGLVQIILVAVIVGGTIGVTKLLRVSADSGPGFSSEQAGLVVDVLKPVAGTHRSVKTLTGEVEARAVVSISPQVNGRVVSVSKKLRPGGAFAPGEPLFEIDPIDFELALETAEAEVAAANADLLQTEATAENFVADWYRVFPDKEPPMLVAREPQVKAAQARLKAAEAQVKLAKLNLDRTRYSVNYPAKVITSSIERGQFVGVMMGGNASYGTLYATDSLRVTASINPLDLARLKLAVGRDVTIRSETGDTPPLTAKISEIGAVLDSQTRLRTITIDLPEEAQLVPGTFVKVNAAGAVEGDIYELPIGALSTSSSVWKVEAERLVAQPVDVVDLDGNYVYVRAFDVADGVVVSEVPTSFVKRLVSIRNTLEPTSRGDRS